MRSNRRITLTDRNKRSQKSNTLYFKRIDCMILHIHSSVSRTALQASKKEVVMGLKRNYRTRTCERLGVLELRSRAAYIN